MSYETEQILNGGNTDEERIAWLEARDAKPSDADWPTPEQFDLAEHYIKLGYMTGPTPEECLEAQPVSDMEVD